MVRYTLHISPAAWVVRTPIPRNTTADAHRHCGDKAHTELLSLLVRLLHASLLGHLGRSHLRLQQVFLWYEQETEG